MQTSNHQKQNGQALLEVLIGLFVLVSGFLGIIALLAQSFAVNNAITNQTKAAYLAAEGIEVAKSLIDHDVYAHLASPPQGAGWTSCFGGGTKYYEIDYTTTNCAPLIQYFTCATEPDYLRYDSGSHTYSYNGAGAVTPFKRCIETQTAGNQITVDSTVTWTESGSQRNLTVEDIFYNWHP